MQTLWKVHVCGTGVGVGEATNPASHVQQAHYADAIDAHATQF